jgi:sec-independent protein translocase protein TatA
VQAFFWQRKPMYKEKLMFHLGTTELLIILVIVLLLFGVGRISKIAGELGKGISSFRDALKNEENSADFADKG